MHTPTWAPGQYALANNLVGFASSTLRVRIEQVLSPRDILVRTADLLNAGTLLNLNASQLQAIDNEHSVRHTTGLITLG